MTSAAPHLCTPADTANWAVDVGGASDRYRGQRIWRSFEHTETPTEQYILRPGGPGWVDDRSALGSSRFPPTQNHYCPATSLTLI